MADVLGNIEKLERDLWEAADNLRANSKLTSSDYFMPVLGVIFLRHAAKPASLKPFETTSSDLFGRFDTPKKSAGDALAELREEGESPSIGIILCKEKNRTVVEYALHDARKPIGVATYQVVRRLPKELKGQLPSPEQIAMLLEEG